MRTFKFTLLTIFCFTAAGLSAQVSINNDGSAPHASAMLEVKSTDKGLLIPRLTTAQRTTLNATATAGLIVYDTDLNLFFYHDGSGWKEGAVGNYWDGDGTSVYLNDINDFVGIGTSTPTRVLEVKGGWQTARISTAAEGPFLEFVGSNTTDWAIGTWSNFFRIISSTDEFSNTLDEYLFTTSVFRSAGDNDKTLGEISARWSNLFSVDGSFSGDVGIGTNSPARKLEVNAGSNWRSARISSTNSGATLEFVSSGNPDWSIGEWTGSMRIFSSTDDFSTSNDEFLFSQSTFRPWSNNTKNLGEASGRWSNVYAVDGNYSGLLTGYNAYFTGNFGIGTSTPARKLEVNAGSAWRSARITSTAPGAFLEFVSSSSTDWSIGEYSGALRILSSTNDFTSSTDEYYITETEFRPFSNNTKLLGVSGARWSNVYSIDGNYSGNMSGNTASFSGLLSGSTATFSGQVAIGSTSFLGKLHVHDDVNGTAKMYITPVTTSSEDSSMVFLAEDDNASFGMYWLYDGSENHLELWGKSNSSLYGPHILVKRDNGQIAIGGTDFATGYQLSVDGKIICTEMRVNLVANWPDYVFKSDYDLMPLDHLREFIKVNGHLPNVPPADQIEESGMDIGEMQRLMMEKIEELSLYIIHQQEEINDLRQQLEAVSK